MKRSFDMLNTPLKGLHVLKRKPVEDARGYLERMFCGNELSEILGGRSISQINHTLTHKRGAVRGMHYQLAPHSEMKIVSCLRGAVFDVAVDLRRSSPTFLKWHGELLTRENFSTMLIPEGFAHGFQTVTDDCEMLYFHTAPYHASSEGALHAQDPRVAIQWPQAITEQSERDRTHAFISDSFPGAMP